MNRPTQILWICMISAVLILTMRSVFVPDPALDILATSDNDDIMRLLSVRGLLAGQGWFDRNQYRILPPDGLPMHWSRYVDLGIAAVIRTAELFLPPDRAEAAALLIWPVLIFALLVVLSGLQVRLIFGPMAAALTVVMLTIWPVTSHQYFRAARIDHHNVQILLTTAMIITLIRPGTPWILGVLGGAAGALSLAIGLETTPLVGLAGLVLAVRAVRNPETDGGHLTAFAITLFAGALPLYLGQTARADWLTSYCDQLSPPALSVLATAGLASLLLVIFARRGAVWVGIVLCVATVLIGMVVASPILRPCLVGPYATLPDDVRALIGKITEARPALSFLSDRPDLFFSTVVPGVGALAVAAIVAWLRQRKGLMSQVEARAIATLMIFGIVTIAGTFIQMRILVMTAPVVPMLAGYGLAGILTMRLDRPTPANAMALLAAIAVTLVPQLIFQAGQAGYTRIVDRPSTPSVRQAVNKCRVPKIIRTLNALPAGVILHQANLGAPIVLLTHHAATSGPYHRRPEVLANGVVPFAADEAGLRAALLETGADYLVLCKDKTYGPEDNPGYATEVAGGVVPDGFTVMDGIHPDLVVLRAPLP